ncbi:MAG: hydrogenase 4 subunit F [Candidatus Eisenbacteria bacterium]|nr:hydrogenase 4 subunit F [Candidatus Eisenbacteria bacterium]
MAWLLPLLLPAPLAGAACLLLGGSPWPRRLAIAAAAATLAAALALSGRVLSGGAFTAAHGWLHADALVALVALAVAGTALPCAWYGAHYMPFVAGRDRTDARWPAGRYEALLLALLAFMLLATAANDLGLMWIAIEGATLVSALLVGYYRRPGAVEAAWKYLILCSVGISLALLATVLLYYSAGRIFGEEGVALQWTRLRDAAGQLDPRFVKLAFLFALTGYGAKAGLAPMHWWLPDAYSQAPAPVAALMSTALLATSLSALLRFFAIAAACAGPAWPGGLFAFFGALSVVMAVPFLLVQGEYKRLLAYSSIEHTGLVTLAIGFGTPLAVFAGLFHLLAQSFAKALAFLLAGSLGRGAHSRRMDHVPGVLTASPALGALLFVAGIGLVGMPPAATFVSEWLALAGGFASRHGAGARVALVALVVAFLGLAFHWTRMLLGRPREDFADPLPAASHAPMWALAGALLVLGVFLPAPLRALIEQATKVVRP